MERVVFCKRKLKILPTEKKARKMRASQHILPPLGASGDRKGETIDHVRDVRAFNPEFAPRYHLVHDMHRLLCLMYIQVSLQRWQQMLGLILGWTKGLFQWALLHKLLLLYITWAIASLLLQFEVISTYAWHDEKSFNFIYTIRCKGVYLVLYSNSYWLAKQHSCWSVSGFIFAIHLHRHHSSQCVSLLLHHNFCNLGAVQFLRLYWCLQLLQAYGLHLNAQIISQYFTDLCSDRLVGKMLDGLM